MPLPSPNPVTLVGFPGLQAKASGGTRPHTVMLVHGILCDHTFLGPWVARLAAHGFTSYAFSRRGRLGVPPLSSRGVGFYEFLADTEAVAAALPRPLLVIGHSLGGLLALKLAERGGCQALVLLAPLPPRGLPPLGRPRFLPPQLAQLGSVLTGGTFHPSYRQASAMFMGRIPRHLRPQLYRRYTPDSGRALRYAYLPGVRVERQRFRLPLLCLVGAEDATIPPWTTAALAGRYGGRFQLLPGHAHELVAEPGFEEIAALIAGWADGFSPRGGDPAQPSPGPA